MAATIGPVWVKCPECQERLPVPFTVTLTKADDDNVTMDAQPDLSEIWSHAWTHEAAL